MCYVYDTSYDATYSFVGCNTVCVHVVDVSYVSRDLFMCYGCDISTYSCVMGVTYRTRDIIHSYVCEI